MSGNEQNHFSNNVGFANSQFKCEGRTTSPAGSASEQNINAQINIHGYI